jgi:accessory gene regulator B
MPEIDDERAEVINYGLQLLIGEIPKIFITLVIAFLLGILKWTLLTVLVITPYRAVSGGVHLHTHVGCVISTTLMYCGTALFAKYIVLSGIIKYIVVGLVWIFGIIMIKLYAPADTENVPILRKKERMIKKFLSYMVFTIGLVIALIIPNSIVSNILVFGYFIQTLTITRLIYKITNNSYGYEIFNNQSNNLV